MRMQHTIARSKFDIAGYIKPMVNATPIALAGRSRAGFPGPVLCDTVRYGATVDRLSSKDIYTFPADLDRVHGRQSL